MYASPFAPSAGPSVGRGQDGRHLGICVEMPFGKRKLVHKAMKTKILGV